MSLSIVIGVNHKNAKVHITVDCDKLVTKRIGKEISNIKRLSADTSELKSRLSAKNHMTGE